MIAYLIPLAMNGSVAGYLVYLWVRGHVAILQGSPGGLHGGGFLAYVGAVMVLGFLSLWWLLEGRPRTKVGIVAVDLAAYAVYRLALNPPQANFAATAAVLAALSSIVLYPALQFFVIGPLLERHSSSELIER